MIAPGEIYVPGIPHDNHYYASQGEARMAALRVMPQGGGYGLAHDPRPSRGMPHYHLVNADGVRVSGHFFYGPRPPRKEPWGRRNPFVTRDQLTVPKHSTRAGIRGRRQRETEDEFELQQLERRLERAMRSDAALEYESEAPARPAPVTITTADSPVVNRVVPANPCQVERAPGGGLRARAASAITGVVIHTMQGHYAHVIDSWRRGGGQACFKAHYAVSSTGEITQVVAERFIAAHANRANGYTVGIEHDGFATDPKNYTEAMYVASAALTRDICLRNSIPLDRANIIGHDEAPGTSHGDPGGYWDWDYYMALVRWDGNAATKPVRVVMSYDGMTLWTASPAWSLVSRSAVRNSPFPEHSYASKYYRAASSSTTDDPAIFLETVPVAGSYNVSAWWPVLAANNPDVQITVRTGPALTPVLTTRVNQKTRTGHVRRTLALPNTPIWTSLGSITVAAGNSVWVEISRRTAGSGSVIADAIRLLKA